jgi:class 3 adenylate cyclase
MGSGWRLRFEDPEVERAFRDDHAQATRVLHRFAAVVALTGWCAIGFIDPQIGGSDANARVLLTLRFGVVAPIIAVGLAWSFVAAPLYRRTHEWVLGGAAATMIVGVALMAGLMPDPGVHRTDQAGSGLLLVVLGTGTFTGLRCVAVLAAIGPAVAAFLVMVARVYPESLLTSSVWLGVATATAGVASYLFESLRRRNWLAARALTHERERSEELLRNVLPEAIAQRLKREPGRIAEHFPTATVLFADLVGFTALAARVPAEELVATLDELFSRFDHLVERGSLEKIKTIGDAYMVVGGVPMPRDDHAHAVAELALAMREVVAAQPPLAGQRLALRIGIASGPLVAGVIGKRKLVYDLWGDTVNTASRMASHGVVDAIQLTAATRALLGDAFAVEPRGEVTVKGKGEMRTWLLRGPRVAAPPAAYEAAGSAGS